MVSLTVTVILAYGARLSDSEHAAKTSRAKMTRVIWGRAPALFLHILEPRQAICWFQASYQLTIQLQI